MTSPRLARTLYGGILSRATPADCGRRGFDAAIGGVPIGGDMHLACLTIWQAESLTQLAAAFLTYRG